MNTQNSNIMKTSKEIYEEFQSIFEETPEDKIETRAHILSLIFLSETEEAMDRKGWTKKRLAKEIGTSASYLTQLFRGDRLLNFKTIAKIEGALEIRFKISTIESRNKELVYSNNSELKFDSAQVNEP